MTNKLFILPLLLVCEGVAQWSSDPSVNTRISYSWGSTVKPVVVGDGSDGAIIAWQEARLGDYGIYVQRVNASGVAQWTSGGVLLVSYSGEQSGPAITSDGSGGAIIVWKDYRSGLANANLYAQRINASGVTQWTSGGVVVCNATEDQSRPRITSDESGGAIIAWEDMRSASATDIYVQRINASGVVQWTANGVVLCSATGPQSEAVLTGTNDGGAIITWTDFRSTGDIYAQRVNASGVVQWTANGVGICTATGAQYTPAIVGSQNKSAIITWYDRRGSDYDVYAQRIDSSGVVQWTANGISISTATADQSLPQLASDGNNGAIIVWQDQRNGTADIYAQRVNSNGDTLWTAGGLAISVASYSQSGPVITSDGSGGAFIAWADGRDLYTESDIYAQWVDAAGSSQWTVHGVAVCTSSKNQTQPVITATTGDLILAWEDNRSGDNYDVYAARLNNDGSLPVQVVEWSAEGGLRSAELRWRTESEVENYGFEVERRVMENGRWKMGNGNETTNQRQNASTKQRHSSPFTPPAFRQTAAELRRVNLHPSPTWTTVGFVPGAGTSSSPREYSFVDKPDQPGRYAYRIRQIDHSGASTYTSALEVVIGLAPLEFSLSQNYPNPFNPSTIIEFTIPEDGYVTLKVFDLAGREVANLVNGRLKAGIRHQVLFDASGLASGIYIARIDHQNRSLTTKMSVVK